MRGQTAHSHVVDYLNTHCVFTCTRCDGCVVWYDSHTRQSQLIITSVIIIIINLEMEFKDSFRSDCCSVSLKFGPCVLLFWTFSVSRHHSWTLSPVSGQKSGVQLADAAVIMQCILGSVMALFLHLAGPETHFRPYDPNRGYSERMNNSSIIFQ